MKQFPTLVLLLAACGAPTGPSDQAELARARARWSALGAETYSFTLDRGCFCVLGGVRVTITVQNGAVANAEIPDSRLAVDATLLTYLPTVPDLFDLIQDAFDRHAASVVVSYDPTYGYPTRIAIDYSATSVDDELSFAASDLLLRPAAAAP